MATETTIRQVLAMLAANYPEQVNKLSEEELTMRRQLFIQALADIDDETIKSATLRHMLTSQWFPKVSELREAAAAIAGQLMPDPMAAWETVRKAMLRYGSYGIPYHNEETGEFGFRPPRFDDPLTQRLVEQMGWRELCLSEEAQALSDRARFLDAYKSQASYQQKQSVLPPALQDGALHRRQLNGGDAMALIAQVAERKRA